MPVNSSIAYSPFSPWQFNIVRTCGNRFLTSQNEAPQDRWVLDWTSFWNVANLGLDARAARQAIRAMLGDDEDHELLPITVPMWGSTDPQRALADRLLEFMPPGIDFIGRATGGSEAIEEAMKLARATTGRHRIVGLRRAYHGQTFGCLGLGRDVMPGVDPFVPGFDLHVDYCVPGISGPHQWIACQDMLDQLEGILRTGQVAALVVEAGIITGWGNCALLPEGFVQGARSLTEQNGALLILDEVGTGFGRLGELFGYQAAGINPDILVFAKALTNGAVPLGIVAASSARVGQAVDRVNLTSTFGLLPLGATAALATFEEHLRLRTWEMARAKGVYLLDQLTSGLSGYPSGVRVRGIGMELGVELLDEDDAAAASRLERILRYALANGLHVVGDGERVIQIMPPLIMPDDEIEEGLEVLLRAFEFAA